MNPSRSQSSLLGQQSTENPVLVDQIQNRTEIELLQDPRLTNRPTEGWYMTQNCRHGRSRRNWKFMVKTKKTMKEEYKCQDLEAQQQLVQTESTYGQEKIHQERNGKTN